MITDIQRGDSINEVCLQHRHGSIRVTITDIQRGESTNEVCLQHRHPNDVRVSDLDMTADIVFLAAL